MTTDAAETRPPDCTCPPDTPRHRASCPVVARRLLDSDEDGYAFSRYRITGIEAENLALRNSLGLRPGGGAQP